MNDPVRPPSTLSLSILDLFLALLLAGGISGIARADPAFEPTVDIEGYVDLRLFAPPNIESWLYNGLGRLPYRGDGISAELGPAALEGIAQLTPDLSAFADIQYDTRLPHPFTLTEAYLTYRLVERPQWALSVKVGEFIPPVSLENDGVGWTSLWTLTSSAINSWVGEEVRSFGGESRLTWRDGTRSAALIGSLFAGNEGTGTLLAQRGWSMGDILGGVPGRLPLPDNDTASYQEYENPFQQIDGHVGWYAGLSARDSSYGGITFLRYQNEADPTMRGPMGFAWRTNFWSVGADTQIGPVTVLGQIMIGDTTVAPSAHFTTNFQAAYVLVGWTEGKWRLAARADVFGTQVISPFPNPPGNENGNAGTVDLTWRALRWLRITGEVVRLDSERSENVSVGLPARMREVQSQLNLRVSF